MSLHSEIPSQSGNRYKSSTEEYAHCTAQCITLNITAELYVSDREQQENSTAYYIKQKNDIVFYIAYSDIISS